MTFFEQPRRAQPRRRLARLRRARPRLPQATGSRMSPRFNRAIIEATAPFAACYKPNIAFYEQFGHPRPARTRRDARGHPADIPVIGDVKRGDIGNTAGAYARAMFERMGLRRRHGQRLPGPRHRRAVPRLRGPRRLRPLPHVESGRRASSRISARQRPACSSSEVARTAIGLVAEHRARGWRDRARRTSPRARSSRPSASLLVPGVGAQGGSPAEVVAAAGDRPRQDRGQRLARHHYAGEGPDFAEAAASGREAAPRRARRLCRARA